MTPLAHMLVKDFLLPVRERKHGDIVKDLGILDGLHFFECSAILEAATALGIGIANKPREETKKLAFLPAPRTLIEFAVPGSKTTARAAYLLEEDGRYGNCRQLYLDRDGTVYYSPSNMRLPLLGSDDRAGAYEIKRGTWGERDESLIASHSSAGVIYALLAMINTPRIIGRRQHMPHRGLEKRLTRQRGMVGKFPLQAWTEIVLEVKPPDIDTGEPHEAHFTGGKALHFCRCHLRIRLGKLELVSAHWRGDPALGIKQSRYRVEPPRAGTPWPMGLTPPR